MAASKATFKTYELVEHTILLLDVENVLNLRATCKYLKNIIDKSGRIHLLLTFTEKANTEKRSWKRTTATTWEAIPYEASRSTPTGIGEICQPYVYNIAAMRPAIAPAPIGTNCVEFSFDARKCPAYAEPKCENDGIFSAMQITKPKTTGVRISVEVVLNDLDTLWLNCAVGNVDGVTVGDVVREIGAEMWRNQVDGLRFREYMEIDGGIFVTEDEKMLVQQQ